jgi:myo-inositol-hexaphosphate 3-phosphohydrolase
MTRLKPRRYDRASAALALTLATLALALVATVAAPADALGAGGDRGDGSSAPGGGELAPRRVVTGIEPLGEAVVPTGTEFDGTVVGGLSGITYDAESQHYLAVSDDRTDARFYGLDIDLSDEALDDGDVRFTSVTPLLDASGQPYAPLSLDPEGIALTGEGTVFISSEGDVSQLISPFVDEFSLDGAHLRSMEVPEVFAPTADGVSGPRNNLVFESLTLSPSGTALTTATENALFQDGPEATVGNGSVSRVLVLDPASGEAVAQYGYPTEAVATEPVPPDAFATNGLVELLALDDQGSFLALERSYSAGVGNGIRLFQSWSGGSVEVSTVESLDGLEVDPPLSKDLVLDFAELGITLDNCEGMTFGPTLADGRSTLIAVSDNNFSDTQFTQFLAFALDIEEIPVVAADVETPPVLDDLGTVPQGARAGDSDDPAIWVHPTRADRSLVIGALKEGGLQATDLSGRLRQHLAPLGVSYNNVDVIYDFPLGRWRTIDLVVASDRTNDTVALFTVDGRSGRIRPFRWALVPPTIFGVDDGEATAYGLAAYTSPTGRSFVFVTQASGNQIAQLELTTDRFGRIVVEEVRRLEAPVGDGEVEDAQSEGVVADPDLGIVYVAMEDGAGILTFGAEPDDPTEPELFYDSADELLVPDLEGLDLYLGAGSSGYLVASSQGDSTFHLWERDGDRAYLGRFSVGGPSLLGFGGVDATDESDGLDIVSAPLGRRYPDGLLVVHDGQDRPQFTNVDGDELENAATNFAYVSWAELADALDLIVDTTRPVR